MPITWDQIVDEKRDLPPDLVADLVDRSLVAQHGGMETSVSDAWKRETHRRIQEIDSGQVEGISGEVVSENIHRMLGR